MSNPWDNDPIKRPASTDVSSSTNPWDNDPIVGVVNAATHVATPATPVAANLVDAIRAGLQSSSMGLILRGKKPDVSIGSDTPWYDRFAGNVAGLVGDAPAMLAGGLAGSEVPLVGTAAGAFAAPQAIREALMTAYSQPDGPMSWSELWDIAKDGVIGGVKGAVLGKVTQGASALAEAGGKALAPVVGETAAPFVAGTLDKGAQITALTAGSAALEGRMPDAQDFLDAAVVIGGLHAVTATAGKLRDIYSKTGIGPSQVAIDSVHNPEIKDTINSSDKVPEAYSPVEQAEVVKAALPDIEKAKKFLNDPDAADKASPIGVSYINSTMDLDSVTRALAGSFDEDVQEQRRGTKTWEQGHAEAAQKLVDLLGPQALSADGSPANLVRVPGQAASQGELGARAVLALSAAEDVKAKIKIRNDAIANGTDTPQMHYDALAAIQRAGMFASHFIGASSETARALNYLKAVKDQSERIKLMQQAVADYNTHGDLTKLSNAIAAANDPSAVLAASRKAVEMGTTEKFLRGAGEVWKAALLSGPHTAIVKGIGDVMAILSTITERAVAAGIGTLRGGTDKVTLDEVHSYGVGMYRGVRDALRVGAEAWKNPDAGPFEHTNVLPDSVKVVTDIPHRVLGAETAAVATLSERGELYAQASRTALSEGYAPGTNEFAQRAAALVAEPTKEMTEASLKAGTDNTFMTKLGGLGQWFGKASRNEWGQFILPFNTVPGNLLKFAIRRMPGVAFAFNDVAEDFKAGGASRDLVLARQAVGAVLAGTAYAAFQSGILTGGGLSLTPGERASKMAAGWQPYSIKIGGKYYSYMRADPLARIASLAADISELQDRVEGDDKASLGVLALGMFGHAAISQTYLSGLNDLLQVLTDPAAKAGTYFDRQIGSWVPAILAQTASAMDPDKRRVDNWLDQIKSRIPGLRETLMPKINPLTGEPEANNKNLTPISVSAETTDPVLQEAERLGLNIPNAPKQVHVGSGTGKIGNVAITPEQQNAYTETQGTVAHTILSQIMAGDGYNALPDAIKSEIFHKVITGSRQRASLAALPPEARYAEVARISQELQAQYQPK